MQIIIGKTNTNANRELSRSKRVCVLFYIVKVIHHDISRYIEIWEEREEREISSEKGIILNCVFLLKLAARHSVFVFRVYPPLAH